MSSSLGRTLRKSSRIQGDITWVDGDRKWMFSTNTVMIIEHVTRTIVNSRYFPMRGVASEVGGFISATSRRKMFNELRIVIPIVIFSEECAGM